MASHATWLIAVIRGARGRVETGGSRGIGTSASSRRSILVMCDLSRTVVGDACHVSRHQDTSINRATLSGVHALVIGESLTACNA
jgi:hypothetical protein